MQVPRCAAEGAVHDQADDEADDQQQHEAVASQAPPAHASARGADDILVQLDETAALHVAEDCDEPLCSLEALGSPRIAPDRFEELRAGAHSVMRSKLAPDELIERTGAPAVGPVRTPAIGQ